MIKSITFFVTQIRVIFALPYLVSPCLGALGSCPSRLPLDPPLNTVPPPKTGFLALLLPNAYVPTPGVV